MPLARARHPARLAGARARGVTVDTRYRYSADGELVESWDKDRGKTEYRYDPIGQLLAMVPDQAQDRSSSASTRAATSTRPTRAAPQRVYGKGNRLLRKGDTLYTWDDDGRLVEKRITYRGVDDPQTRCGATAGTPRACSRR